MATRREMRGEEAFRSRFSVSISGADEVKALLTELGKKGQPIVKDVLTVKAKHIVARAKPLTPDDPETQGALRDSVRLHSVVPRKNSVTAYIVVGGEPLAARLKGHHYWAWALVQHEDLTLQHPHGGQAKFIEQPLLEVAPTIPDALLDALGEAANG